jgi:hypothetical protein
MKNLKSVLSIVFLVFLAVSVRSQSKALLDIIINESIPKSAFHREVAKTQRNNKLKSNALRFSVFAVNIHNTANDKLPDQYKRRKWFRKSRMDAAGTTSHKKPQKPAT